MLLFYRNGLLGRFKGFSLASTAFSIAGAAGVVRLVEHKSTGMRYALLRKHFENATACILHSAAVY